MTVPYQTPNVMLPILALTVNAVVDLDSAVILQPTVEQDVSVTVSSMFLPQCVVLKVLALMVNVVVSMVTVEPLLNTVELDAKATVLTVILLTAITTKIHGVTTVVSLVAAVLRELLPSPSTMVLTLS